MWNLVTFYVIVHTENTDLHYTRQETTKLAARQCWISCVRWCRRWAWWWTMAWLWRWRAPVTRAFPSRPGLTGGRTSLKKKQLRFHLFSFNTSNKKRAWVLSSIPGPEMLLENLSDEFVRLKPENGLILFIAIICIQWVKQNLNNYMSYGHYQVIIISLLHYH